MIDALTRGSLAVFVFVIATNGASEEVEMNIYVGNLSFSATESEIEHVFGEHGKVKSVNIVKDRDTGQSRGFGFVEMIDDQAAKRAIAAVNGRDISGRSLSVNEVRPRAERSGDSGRRW